MQHDSFEPSFVVDVTADWATKLQALAEGARRASLALW